jgi:hypothetical protein
MSQKVTVISRFTKGINLHSARAGERLAYDSATGQPEPQHATITLKPGVNEIDLATIQRFEKIAVDMGLRFVRANDCFYVSDARPQDRKELLLFRALASDRVISVQ